MFYTKAVSAIFVAAGLSAVSHAAMAENKHYVGGNLAWVEYTEDLLPDEEASLTAIYGRLGTQFHENFSAEIRLGFGVDDDTVTIDGSDVDVSLENFFGGYVRGGVQAGTHFYPYLIAGYTRGEVEGEGSGIKEDSSESDFSYGIGADIKLSETVSGNIEYMNYYDKDGVELDGFAVGLSWSF